jgi:hypothetical protein
MIFHSELLKVITYLSRARSVIIRHSSSSLNGVRGKLKFETDAFKIKASSPQINFFKLKLGKEYKKFLIKLKPYTLILEDIFINSVSTSQLSGSIDQLYTQGYQKGRKYYYRLVIPIDFELNFLHVLQDSIFESDLGARYRGGLITNFGSEQLTTCYLNNSEYKFISIESNLKQNYHEFSNKVFSVLCGLGFITGCLPGGSGFYFAYLEPKMAHYSYFYFSQFRRTVKSSHYPVYSNPYGYLSTQKELADWYYSRKLLRNVNKLEFSNLCVKLENFIELKGVVILIIESMSASVGLMPGGLSIALETLSDIILDDLEINMAPIKTKSLRDKILSEFRDTLLSNKEALGDDAYHTLSLKIENINQPTNKARLEAPFNKLNIKLSKKDIEILKTRNDFLHGRIPDIKKLGENRSMVRKSKDSYYAAMRLYTLINLLILKWIGFDNYVLNHPVIQNEICQVHLRERPYRKISKNKKQSNLP